ncbi:MAG: hypothetical protein GY716_15575 [bacterium]|nr:hypothetical protein [bacterium]
MRIRSWLPTLLLIALAVPAAAQSVSVWVVPETPMLAQTEVLFPWEVKRISPDDLITVFSFDPGMSGAGIDAVHGIGRPQPERWLFSTDVGLTPEDAAAVFPGVTELVYFHDVLLFDGAGYSHFLCSANLPPLDRPPAGANLDALYYSVDAMGNESLEVSFDVVLDLQGQTITRNDIARYERTGPECGDWSYVGLVFSGSASLIPPFVNLIGATKVEGDWAFTFDVVWEMFPPGGLVYETQQVGRWDGVVWSVIEDLAYVGWNQQTFALIDALHMQHPDVTLVPADDALDVPPGSNVTAAFASWVDSSTVNAGSFGLYDAFGAPVPTTLAVSPDGHAATLDPVSSLVADSVYTVEITDQIADGIGRSPDSVMTRFETAEVVGGGIPLPTVSEETTLPAPPPAPTPPMGGARAGSVVGDNLGFSVAEAGSLNGDAYLDFLAGSPGYGEGATEAAGAVVVVLGSADGAERQEPDIIYVGESAHDRAGTAVAGNFDFNYDGRPDLLIGAEQVNRSIPASPVDVGPGRVYLVYFDPQDYDLGNSPVFVDLGRVGNPGHPDGEIPGVVFHGVTLGDQAGFALAVGELDPPPPPPPPEAPPTPVYADVVLGAPGVGGNDGAVYVVRGGPGLSGSHSLGDVGGPIGGRVYQVSPPGTGERLGSSLALPGDITDAGLPDVAMGAPLADTTHVDAGRVYVAEGDTSSGTTAVASIATQIHGTQTNEQLGFSVAGGGDNLADENPVSQGGDLDLLIGAPFHDVAGLQEAGRVLHASGRLPANVIGAGDIGTTLDGVEWRGAQDGGRLGWSVARLGDISGNSLQDVGLGAPFVNTGTAVAGAMYMIEGSAVAGSQGSIDVDLVGQIVSGGVFIGTQASERAAIVFAAAGDVDQDPNGAAADFAVGSPGWNNELGTVHQVLESVVQVPGECRALGCTVADLGSGGALIIPDNSLATGSVLLFELEGFPSHVCGNLGDHTLIGSLDSFRSDSDCADPPCAPPAFAVGVSVELPIGASFEGQLQDGEALELRYCDPTFGWFPVPGGPSTATVRENRFYDDRKALLASGLDELRLYGVFFADEDGDGIRDALDCGGAGIGQRPGEVTLSLTNSGTQTTLSWSPPDEPGGDPADLIYDTIRSSSPTQFDEGTAVCLETDGVDTQTLDSDPLAPGETRYYLVRSDLTGIEDCSGSFGTGRTSDLACL